MSFISTCHLEKLRRSKCAFEGCRNNKYFDIRVNRKALFFAQLSKELEHFLSLAPTGTRERLLRAEDQWSALKLEKPRNEAHKSLLTHNLERNIGEQEFDVAICGGILGVFFAVALQMRGLKVAIIERGRIVGRDQEWNVSRKELEVLVRLQLLTEQELESCIYSVFESVRVGFGHEDKVSSKIIIDNAYFVRDVLDVGVSPKQLLNILRSKFEELGGIIFEYHAFEHATICKDGVELILQQLKLSKAIEESLGAGGQGILSNVASSQTKRLYCSLLLDAMGSFSPIMQHIRGTKQKPDGICVVVGSCSEAPWQENVTADAFFAFTPVERRRQYFFEAFPARDGRTTYMFSYLDAEKGRPSLIDIFEDYLHYLPIYQQVPLASIKPKRVLFGFFPSYRQSPLKSSYDRILQVGDSSGLQSPLSFGGFGAVLRHLSRLTLGVEDVIRYRLYSAGSLAYLSPYLPSLSVTWLFQRAMSVPLHGTRPKDYEILHLLSLNFQVMNSLEQNSVLSLFLRDVVQFTPLTKTLLLVFTKNPPLIFQVISYVGLESLVEWYFHYISLGIYGILSRIVSLSRTKHIQGSNIPPSVQYRIVRFVEAWTYGSGRDVEL